jgi:hypothetical protein
MSEKQGHPVKTIFWFVCALLLVALLIPTVMLPYIVTGKGINEFLRILIDNHMPAIILRVKMGYLLRQAVHILMYWLIFVIALRILLELVKRTAAVSWQKNAAEILLAIVMLVIVVSFFYTFFGWATIPFFRHDIPDNEVLVRFVVSILILLSIVLIMPKPRQTIRELIMSEKRCSNCHRVLPITARAGETCPYCGAYWSYEVKHDLTHR